MTTATRKSRARAATRSVTDMHRAWLELVDTEGPFLSIPVLKRVWPTGMPPMNADALETLRDAKPAFEKAWEEWDSHREDAETGDRYLVARNKWVDTILREVIGWGPMYTTSVAEVKSPNGVVTVRATGALVHRELTGALVLLVDPVDSLRDPLDDGWAASPIDRMEELLRSAGVGIGVVTDGRWWAVVSARKDTMVASGVVDAQTWIEEPFTRNAFVEILNRKYLVGGKAENRLTELFGESVAAAEEITEALGTQVKQAVELLVQALSEASLEAGTRGEPDPLPAQRSQVYEAAVTVMMRVVFLLFAEERNLLPQSGLFTAGYGITDRLDVLDQRAREESTEVLDSTYLTWHRLLATSEALYRGASFEDIRIPSYGGSLFDPDRFEFLTARTEAGTLAVRVSDRVMLEVLRAVQIAAPKGQDARRISFRDVDVEQIGYIYEGLLGYSCAPVEEVTVGLIGPKGVEPEITLRELEALAAANPDPATLAEEIVAWAKDSQPAAKLPTKTALAKAIRTTGEIEDAENAVRNATSDEALRERLRPFIGIIRRDLRNRPFVVAEGGVIVVETPSRSSAGAHYTPRSLAEEVVKHALEPLVYSPGPHQTADRDSWRLIAPELILELKVADIACGSGAFLVAAARFLAARLVESRREFYGVTGPAHDLHLHAIREVVAHCLYGADINPMAVEMCKLSLWLVSLDPKLPFSFVDDKVLHGNSLLGLTDVRQLKSLHIYPNTAAQDDLFNQSGAEIDDILHRASILRRNLASEVDNSDPQRSVTTKRRQWRHYQELTARLRAIADGVVAAGLMHGGKPGKALNEAYENLRVAVEYAFPQDGRDPDTGMLDRVIGAGLTPTVLTDYACWTPLHWVLEVPDVMERGGFDAVIGNPPFIAGSEISGVMGTNIRDFIVNAVAGGKRGNADFVAYFFVRAHEIVRGIGIIGLIATNTIAQLRTREVGLETLVESGLTITRSIQSRKWPSSSASIEYAAVWGTWRDVDPSAPIVADGVPVRKISTLLESVGRVGGIPSRLTENRRICFEGCKPNGAGFVVDASTAQSWIASDNSLKEVLFPFLGGADLNSQPTASATRWVIDFYGLAEEDIRNYPQAFCRVVERVKPVRVTNRGALSRTPWWVFERPRPLMREAISNLETVLCIALTSSTVMPMRVSNGQVFGNSLGVFAVESYADLAILSSCLHQLWAITYGSTMRTDIRYTPSDVFETFPRPRPSGQLMSAGHNLHVVRSEIMQRRELGLTKLYNLVNDPEASGAADPDVRLLRRLHEELDHVAMAAYGWDDVSLDHGFHSYRQMQRWTVSPAARAEILDRLLEENHRRAAIQGDALIADADAEEDE
ncbi:Eco57I restriction-modification methylase domain-containing protein [Nocardia sp. CC227C]|uniref:Eco57I restriction-modification methylase domain-containing protein n=1 Tax=Nocardia sp. CC227C TaxID=3044562 RepID=UPI00278BBD64|nr:type IIL restriction-modification enzyme MmeI [Nocardia sp. CC227C]